MENSLQLGHAYGGTLERIKTPRMEKARLEIAVLMWISRSSRPLQLDEMPHAMAIRIGSNDLNKEAVSKISTFLASCHGLATMEKGASSIRLINFTLQEYICTRSGLFDLAHSTMVETCLTGLNFYHVKNSHLLVRAMLNEDEFCAG